MIAELYSGVPCTLSLDIRLRIQSHPIPIWRSVPGMSTGFVSILRQSLMISFPVFLIISVVFDVVSVFAEAVGVVVSSSMRSIMVSGILVFIGFHRPFFLCFYG